MDADATHMPDNALVEPHHFAGMGRGLRCTRNVAAGEELMAVSIDDCWHGADARAAPELRPLLDAGVELSDFDAVAIHLLVERAKGAASKRARHLQDMPAVYDLTLFWSAAELDELKGSRWFELAARFAEELAADWAALQASIAAAASQVGDDFLPRLGVDFEGYKWAYATSKSRGAQARVGGQYVRLLAPGFDLFNHDDALDLRETHGFDDGRRVLRCVATRAYAKGEQAHISYGNAANSSLLLSGGFVMEENPHESVEISLTSEVDANRLNAFMLASPEAPPEGTLPTFEFLQVPDDETIAAGGGSSPFTTKHLLTKAVPLPASLVAFVRLDRLGDEEWAAQCRKAEKAGKTLHEAVRAEQPLDASHELVSLGALRGVVEAMLAAYPTSLDDDRAELATPPPPYPPDSAPSRSEHRRRMAVTLRAAEKAILADCLVAIDARLRPQLRSLLADALAQEAACRKAGQSWPTMLTRRGPVLERAAPRVSLAFERLHSCDLGGPEVTAAIHAQVATAWFLALAGLGRHPLATATAYVHEASALEAAEAAAEAEAAALPPAGALPPLLPEMLRVGEAPQAGGGGGGDGGEGGGGGGDGGSALPYLSLYNRKMRMWSSYLLAQWGVARAISPSDSNTMGMEAHAIRNDHAWSVPTEAALSLLASHSPILELGAGNGLWAGLLRARGADVLAFDTRRLDPSYAPAAADVEEGAELMGKREAGVDEGGPEMGAKHSSRALMLAWPDYGGAGSYASSCLQAYGGDTLLLLGEWRGRTFGAYTAGLGDEGQSFSPAFQDAVEADFELVAQQRLPSWPYFVDSLMVWRRRIADAD